MKVIVPAEIEVIANMKGCRAFFRFQAHRPVAQAQLEILRDVGPFGGRKDAGGCGIQRGFVFVAGFWVLRDPGRPRWAQSVGPERPWKLDTSQIRWSQEFGALWEAK